MKTKILTQLINAVKIAVKSFPPILIVEHINQEIKDYEPEKRANT